jgi:hypothetical protein
MDQNEYRAALDALSYSRRAWAHLTDQSFRGVQKKAAEGAAVQGPEAALLELLIARPELKTWMEVRRPLLDKRRSRKAS